MRRPRFRRACGSARALALNRAAARRTSVGDAAARAVKRLRRGPSVASRARASLAVLAITADAASPLRSAATSDHEPATGALRPRERWRKLFDRS